VTFRESPASVLMKEAFPGSILSPRQKMERLESLGIAVMVVIDFSDHLSKLSGKAFIGLLRENLAVAKIVAGYNFRLGKERDTGARDLRRMFRGGETRVEEIGPVHYRGEVVSSSRIRGLIREGSFSDAFAMLTTWFSLDLRDFSAEPSLQGGMSRLRINRKDIRQCLPKPGRYPVSCRTENGSVPGSLTVMEDSVDLEWAGRKRIGEAEFQAVQT
jgi:FAD synthase